MKRIRRFHAVMSPSASSVLSAAATAAGVLAAILAASAGASAQDSGASPRDVGVQAWAGPVMTEAEAVAAALAASDEVSRLDSRVYARQKKVDRAPFNVRNPELRFGDISTEYADPGANHKFELGLRWRLPKYGEVDELVATSRLEYWDARVDAFVYKNDLATAVRMAWLDVVYLNREVETANRRVDVAARQLDVVGRLVELGEVPFVRKVKAQTSLMRARRDLAAARNSQDAGRQRLGAMTGGVPVDSGPYDPPIGDLDLAALVDTALRARPEYEFENQRLALARSEKRANDLKMIPNFSFVEAAYHYESLNNDWGELSFGIEVPLFHWIRGKPLEINDGAGRETRSFAGTEELSQDIADAYVRWSGTRAAWLSLKSEYASAADGIRNTIDEARARAVPEADVIELEMSALDLEQMLVEAERDYAWAVFELCGAVGVDDCGSLFSR